MTTQKPNQTRYALNPRLFWGSIIVIAIAVPSIYFWHARSLTKISSIFLADARELIDQADQLQAVGNFADADESLRQAVDLIWQYRNIHPEDGPAMILLARTFDRAPQGKSNRNRAAQLYLEAIARSDEAEAPRLRLRAAEIYLESGDFAAAEQIAQRIISDAEESNGPGTEFQALASRILVLASYRQLIQQNWSGGPEGVLGSQVAQAITLNPYDTELPILLASTYRIAAGHQYLSDAQRQGLTEGDVSVTEQAAQTADQIVDQMVQRNLDRARSVKPPAEGVDESTADVIPSSSPTLTPAQSLAEAYLRRFFYRELYGIEGADEDLLRASQNDPDNPAITYQQGLALWQQHQQENAADANPDSLTPEQITRLNQAAAYFESCLKSNPEALLAQLNLGDIQLALGDVTTAMDHWKSTLGKAQEYSEIPMMADCYSRLVGALIDLDRTQEALEQLDAMDRAIQRYSLRTGDPRLMSELSLAQQLLTGALQFKNRTYATAIETLEKALANQSAQASRQTFGIFRLLGNIYSQLGQPARAAQTYREALKYDGNNREFRLLLSDALSAAGQLALAAQELERLLSVDAKAEEWLAFTRLLYQKEVKEPAHLRNWQALDNALRQTQQFAQQLSDDQRWEFQSLFVQAQLAWTNPDQAESDTKPGDITLNELMEGLEAQAGASADRIRSLILIYRQTDQPEKAQHWLDKLETVSDQTAERYILQAELLAADNKMDEAAAKLDEGLAAVNDDQRQPLQLAQVSFLLNHGDYDQALAKLTVLTELYPAAPELIVQLAELVVQVPHLIAPEPAAWEQRLLELEGEHGPYTNFLKAQRAVLAYSDAKDPNQRDRSLRVANNLCFAILRVRPNWPAAYALAGLVDQLQSEWVIEKNRANPVSNQQHVSAEARKLQESAIANLKQALGLGDRRSAVLLLLTKLDPSASQDVLALLSRQRIIADPRFSKLEWMTLVEKNDLANAELTSIEATEKRPNDPAAWLDRGQIEIMRQSAYAAEQSLARARELIAESPEPLASLVELFSIYLVGREFSTGLDDRKKWNASARELIPQILELTATENRLLQKAKLLSEVGDDQAGDAFLLAERQDPENMEVLQESLNYFVSRDSSDTAAFDEALRVGFRLLNLNPAESGIRQLLANMFASRGSVDDWNMINQIYDEKELSKLPPDPANKRVLAALLLSNRDVPNAERLNNFARAEAAIKEGQTAADHALRGQIYREWAALLDQEIQDAKLESAAESFTQAAQAPDINSFQLFRIIDFFIEQPQWKTEQPDWETPARRLDVADIYIRKLKSLVGDSIRDFGPAVAMEARLLHRRGQLSDTDNSAAIVRVVEDYGQQVLNILALSKPERARYCLQVAQILDSVETDPDLVLQWLEMAFQEDRSQRLALATGLAKNGDLDRALDECLIGYQETKSPDYAIAMTGFLLTGDSQARHFENADPILEQALRDFPNNAVLLDSIASLRFAGKNQVQEAIELYERALNIDVKNQFMANNLATAYAELPDQLPKALEVVEAAIAKHGLRPSLVDTRATIWMRQGKLDLAEAELRKIINQQADPRFWCHLAEVKWKQYEKTGNVNDANQARAVLESSVEKGLEKQVFTAGERERLSTLRKNLEISGLTTSSRNDP